MSTEFGQSFCRMNYRNRQELSSGRPKPISAQGMNNSTFYCHVNQRVWFKKGN